MPSSRPGATASLRGTVLPRGALGVLAVSAIGLFLTVLGPGPAGLRSTLALPLSSTALAATWWIVRWRARRSTAERAVWRMFSLGCLLYGIGAVVTVVVAIVPRTAPLAEVPAGICGVLTFPLAYRALVRWSRHGSGVDPDDLLNGCGSLLVLTAVLGSLLVWTAPEGHTAGGGLLTSLPGLRQVLLVQDSAVIVLVVAALTAAFAGRLYRDIRLWLVTSAYLLAGAGGLAALVGGGVTRPAWSLPVWALGLLALSTAAILPVRFVPTQSADPVKSTVGSFVVVLAGLGTAVAVVATGAPGVLAVLGLAGVLGSSVRLLVNTGELAQLAASREEALTDDLTGIANRRAIVRQLDHTLAHPGTREPGLQVVVFDLDHFKEVNDGLGHSAGDDLLRMVAQRVKPALPAATVLGRLGGDEFAIVSNAGAQGDEVLSALDEAFAEPFHLAGMSVHVDLSVGRAHWPTADSPGPGGSVDAAMLLRRADTAMYDAKRNDLRCTTYDSARHAETRGLLSMVADLRQGIAGGQLRLHYQPQLVASTGALAGVEALVRWQHPVLGLLMPGQFLPLAESHALMDALTREVLEQAVAQQARWHRDGLHVRVSVNLAAGTLLDTSLPATVNALLTHHRVPATSLVLEVTETALLREPERSLSVVEGLRALGAQVSIDDFGTGYSSLTQLRQLPVSELKLDRSFTMDLLSDPRAAAIVANTINLAHALQLRVVAEGVEDEATLAALAALACDETQGYLHARPLPADEFDTWLAQRVVGAER
ncbi:putative bifunctional diguanylate cyclase/phosphodiesterase [Kineococcus sp. GCM10028916]|uniref:putative bifunctional diguanylate cyclase/phosphodiesterase n=1 Tax=Kineococcus sp. GCM10028916 TaxID=3273394 RepID=UPI0036D2D1B5